MVEKPRAYQRFFAELKRRRVFNTAALYGGIAFVVFQVADFVLPALRLSDWVSTAIVILALVGFPVVMVLAWFYDLTSGGMRFTPPPKMGELEAIVSQSLLRRWTVGLAAAGGIALLVAGVWWRFGETGSPELSRSSRTEPPVSSVAVLPFLTLSGSDREEYLGEGIARELLDALSASASLQVTAWTSALSLNDPEIDLETVARELGVVRVVEGSVGTAGEDMEVAVRVIRANDLEQIWARSYLLPRDGFLSGLDLVAREIAVALGVELRMVDGETLVRTETESFPAYTDYLRGRYHAHRGTLEDLEAAVEFYHRAIVLDPDFSSAWSALATAYVLIPEVGGPPMMQLLPYAQAAVQQAVAPGRERAEGYAASAYLEWVYLWDLQQAEADFRRSIELEPNNPIARYWFAQLLTTQRRWDEAMEEAQKALEIDPRSAPAYLTLGLLLSYAGEQGAPAALQQALELAPTMHPAAFVLAMHLAFEGDLEGAEKEFERFSSMTGTDPSVFRAYLAALSDPSRLPEAISALQNPGFYGAVQGAGLLAHIGARDAAISVLEQSAQARSPYLPWVNALPHFELMRSDSRFQGVLAWIGF